MLTIVLSLAGVLVGATIAQGEGALFGAALGALLGLWIGERDRIVRLTQRIDELHDEVERVKRQVQTLRRADEPSTTPAPTPARSIRPAPLAGFDPTALEPLPARLPSQPPGAPVPPRVPVPPSPLPAAPPAAAPVPPAAPPVAAPPPAAPPPSAFDSALLGARELLLGGNTVVRVGVLVLLVGITLLLKYAADHALFPIELRMAAAAALGLAMVVFGLRQRDVRPGFARTLQGGGVAAMYLVVFFSFRTYGLISAGPAFALLAVIAAASAALAVMQNAVALVVIGQIGGFLAPILASTGSGNHVALFSYYLVLNLAIFAIALVRAWRVLNVIGFLFTFGVGTAWGVMRYEPANFASTEPFLIAFFLLYVAIPVIFALRGEVRGFIDGSLVFGAPLCFLGLQLALVREIPFAMAYSSLGLAALYVGLARYLQRRAPDALRALVEVFLALGVGFGTLAIPYGLDNAGLTSASWALEGAGLYWVGVRQQRWLSRAAGVVLQGMAGISLLVHVLNAIPDPQALPLLNTRMLAAALLGLSSLFIARHAYLHRGRVFGWESPLLQALIGWGLLFFLALAFDEIDSHVQAALQPGANVALLGATGLALELAGRRLGFLPGRYPAALLVVLLGPYALGWETSLGTHLFGRGGWFGWPAYFASVVLTLARLVPDGPRYLRYLHPIALWGAALFIGLELYWLTLQQAALSEDWAYAALGAGAIALLAWVTVARPTRWPLRGQHELYLGLGACVLCAAILLWSLAFNLHARGLSAPLPYLPLLNPIDLAQLLGCAAMFAWARAYQRRAERELPADLLAAAPAVLGCALFIWFNAMLARSVHQFADVPFSGTALWRSVALQVALSVSWSAIGLCLTVFASRRALRGLWIVGAVLLGVVVCKLFVIDLARLSTIAKIGTFLVVGVLLLLVGYLAPVPPGARPPTPAPAPDEPLPQPRRADAEAPGSGP